MVEQISGDGSKIAELEKYFHGKYERAGFTGFDGATEWLACSDELLGELGWCDEVAETGVDPLAWARNEIKDLHKTIKRLRGSLELRNAAEQSVRWTGLRRCPFCNALLEEQSVYCDTCGSDTPRQ